MRSTWPCLPRVIGEDEHQDIGVIYVRVGKIGRDEAPGPEALQQDRQHAVHAARQPAVGAVRRLEPIEKSLLVEDDLLALQVQPAGSERSHERQQHSHEDRRQREHEATA